MRRTFQIFREPTGNFHAVREGWAWSALPLPWLWAFLHRMGWLGVKLLLADLLVVFLAPALLASQPIALGLVLAIPRVIALLKGNHWLAMDRENRNDDYVGTILAARKSDAVAHVARNNGIIPVESRPQSRVSGFEFPPRSLQQMWAVSRLTLRAAFRYRLVVVLIVSLLCAVVALPMVIKHDGTAQGFTQILLTYTLGVTAALLSIVTLWLACGTLARDVDECQMQVVATKPIPRWQIWLGKWTGILVLNLMLLGIASGAVYLMMQWRATQLPPEVQEALRSNVLTARAVVREPPVDIDGRVEQLIRERFAELQSRGVNLEEFRVQARETIKARDQLIPPDHFRRVRLDFSRSPNAIAGKPIYVRLKFHTPELSAKRPYEMEIVAGPPESPDRQGAYRSLAAEATHEIGLDPVPLDDSGMLIVDIANRSDTPLIIPLDDGFELLYPEGGFGLNYVRAVLVIACWLGLLAAIGLSAASFLSFPVAAFLATTVLILGLSSGTLKTVVEDQTVLGFKHDTTEPNYPAIDWVMVPLFELLLETVNLVHQFSPIDAVSSGRSITWFELGRAIGLVVILMGGMFAVVGIIAFTRRELATAQTHI